MEHYRRIGPYKKISILILQAEIDKLFFVDLLNQSARAASGPRAVEPLSGQPRPGRGRPRAGARRRHAVTPQGTGDSCIVLPLQ